MSFRQNVGKWVENLQKNLVEKNSYSFKTIIKLKEVFDGRKI